MNASLLVTNYVSCTLYVFIFNVFVALPTVYLSIDIYEWGFISYKLSELYTLYVFVFKVFVAQKLPTVYLVLISMNKSLSVTDYLITILYEFIFNIFVVHKLPTIYLSIDIYEWELISYKLCELYTLYEFIFNIFVVEKILTINLSIDIYKSEFIK